MLVQAGADWDVPEVDADESTASSDTALARWQTCAGATSSSASPTPTRPVPEPGSENLDTGFVEDVGVLINHKKEIHEVAGGTILFFKPNGFSDISRWYKRR